MKRSQRRAPNLTSWDRLMLGFCTLLVLPKRVRKMAVMTKPSTLLSLHQTGRNHAGSAQWRSCASNRKPSLIPLAKTLQRPLSDPGRRLSCISPHTQVTISVTSNPTPEWVAGHVTDAFHGLTTYVSDKLRQEAKAPRGESCA